MSVAQFSRLLPISVGLALVMMSASVVADPMPGAPNNVDAIVPGKAPAPSPATLEALAADGANTELKNADTSPYQSEIDEVAMLQRQNRILKLKVDAANLRSELDSAAAKSGDVPPGGAPSPVAATRAAPPSGPWMVTTIQGVGGAMSATLQGPNGEEVYVGAGSMTPLGKVIAIGRDGVVIRKPNGSTSQLSFGSAVAAR